MDWRTEDTTMVTMNIRTALGDDATTLTKSERRIGTRIMEDWREIPMLTAAQLAERAGVHESTVVRFAQKLGFDGFAEFRAHLVSEVTQEFRGYRAGWVKEQSDQSVPSLLTQHTYVLDQLSTMLPQAEVDAGARTMLDAARIYIVGVGYMAPAADILGRKLRILGLDATEVHDIGRSGYERVAVATPDDAFVVFTMSEDVPLIDEFLARTPVPADRRVLITDPEGMMGGLKTSATLCFPRGNGVSAMVSIVSICYLLEHSVFSLDPERVRLGVERYNARAGDTQHL